ncbi:MAG TPA: ABC transporter permease [Vitreimonas sp.]|uniref:ABC transporter permease n=1 Tax=Vitreimonas sp. TaxID=3069702 RepID=UPI002D261D42|nr:ABC transporter permease [Vitreimonas sp.]HYD87726.1 ABC transporter permease [Vitreimonas sp.]
MSIAAVAFRDLAGSLARLPLAARLAVDDIHGKYRRTILGPLWIAIGQAAIIAGFILVFSGLFDTPPEEYALYLAAGFPVWALMSQYLVDTPFTFIQHKGVLESFELPWLTLVWRRSISYVLLFLHHIVTLFAVMAILRVTPTIEMLYAIPALFIVIIAGTGVGMFLAVFGARYRDIQPAMSMAVGFLFMFTPVMWRADQLLENEWAYQYNPLYYYVTLAREPLLGRVPPMEMWISAGGGAVALFIFGFLSFLIGRRRLYHWL